MGSISFCIRGEGKDQAEHFLEVVGNDSQVLLALDIEENRGDNITPKQEEDLVNEIHKVTGRLPLIYGSADFLKDFSTPTLTKFLLWIARWGEVPILPKVWNTWILWQYTNGQMGPEPHSVKGIGLCDRNKFNGTLEELKKFWLLGEQHC